MNIKELFTEHPASVNETYFEHLYCALYFASYMAYISCICIIHAIFPFLFKYTSSDKLGILYSQMTTYRKS